MKVKYYRTEWESDKEEDRRCRFEMLNNMIDNDVKNHPGLKPRLLHITDKWYHGCVWVVAIVVWEQ
jgi:hypothetical protein